jgi:hypothetical protein
MSSDQQRERSRSPDPAPAPEASDPSNDNGNNAAPITSENGVNGGAPSNGGDNGSGDGGTDDGVKLYVGNLDYCKSIVFFLLKVPSLFSSFPP